MAEIREIIATALSEYRCQHTTEDEDGIDGLPLVDKLTPPDQTSIDLGLKELDALADHIADALANDGEEPQSPTTTGGEKE